MKKNVIFILLLMGVSLFAQNNNQSKRIVNSSEITDTYNRIAITPILLDNQSGGYFDMLKQSFSKTYITDKYDNNTIPKPTLKPTSTNLNSSLIREDLENYHFVNQVIAKCFSRKADGSFGVELLHQRGLYNATDADVLNAQASKRGIDQIRDMGMKLVNNSYIIAYNIEDLIDMNEYYNRQQQKSKTIVTRYKNGFTASITAYVYQLDFNDTIKDAFFSKHWVDNNDPDMVQKKLAYDNFKFPVKFISSSTFLMESSQWNPGYSTSPLVQATREELMFDLIQGGINQSLAALEDKLPQFMTASSIFKTWPLRAKIGKKEDVSRDDRYFVYQMEQNNKGNILGKRKGVIRARKVADNRQVASGQSPFSSFYQVGGGIIKKGMVIQQKRDAGGAFSFGASMGGVQCIDGRLEINMTQLIWSSLPSMTKFFIEGAFEPASKELIDNYGTKTQYSNFVRYGFGIGKEYCLLHYFRLQPFIGIGFEEITNNSDSKRSLKSLYIHPGVTFGINLKYNLQLYYQYSDYMMNNPVTLKDGQNLIQTGVTDWGSTWKRGGATNSIGLRFEL